MSGRAVETDGLTKRYAPDVLAVDGVSLEVDRGELYAFLGLNGAGKSTTIRMLLGMIRPTSGTARVLGEPVTAEAPGLWSRVGHLVDVATAYPELTVRENLDVARRLHRMRDRKAVGLGARGQVLERDDHVDGGVEADGGGGHGGLPC